MKAQLTILLILSIITGTLAQAVSEQGAESGNNKYSNNKILTAEDMVFIHPVKPIESIPIAKETVLIFDFDGSLKSYDLNTKKINWTVATTEGRQFCDNKLTVSDGVVYVPFVDGEIWAINNQTGEIFWKTSLGSKRDGRNLSNQKPIIYKNKVIVTTQHNNTNIYALDKEDGSLMWNYKLAYPYNSEPLLLQNDIVYVQSGPIIYGFDAETGELLSGKRFEKGMYGQVVGDEQNIFATDDDTVFCMNTSSVNLDILWKYAFDKVDYAISEKIFYQDSCIYFGGKGNGACGIYSLDSKTGKLIWRKHFEDADIGYLTHFKNDLWAMTEDGILIKIDMKSGEILIEKKLLPKPISNFEFVDADSFYYYAAEGLVKYSADGEPVIYEESKSENPKDRSFIKVLR